MARDCEELLDCARYWRTDFTADVILANSRLLWPGDGEREESSMSVALADLRPTELSRARMAIQAAAFMQGAVVTESFHPEHWVNGLLRLATVHETAYMDWVVAIPKEAIPELPQLRHVPGVGQPGLAGICIAVTDAPELIDRTTFDLVVTESNDVGLAASRIFRMISVLTASYTVTCLDSVDMVAALTLGRHIHLVTVYWDVSTHELIFPTALTKVRLAQARGIFWSGDLSVIKARHISTTSMQTTIQKHCAKNAEVIFGLSVGQHADAWSGPLCEIHVLCAI